MEQKKLTVLLIVWIMGLACGCQSMPTQIVTQDPVQVQPKQLASSNIVMPVQVRQALLPALQLDLPQLPQHVIEPRFDVTMLDIPASEAFVELVKDSPYSVLVHSSVRGKVSLQVKATTVREVFALIEKVYGYTIEREENQYVIYGKAIE